MPGGMKVLGEVKRASVDEGSNIRKIVRTFNNLNDVSLEVSTSCLSQV